MQLINTTISWLSAKKNIFLGKEDDQYRPKWKNKKQKKKKPNKKKGKKRVRNEFKSRAGPSIVFAIENL